MADNEIDIVFGAQISGLIAGATQVKEEIEGIRGTVDTFVGALGGVAGALAEAFAVERIAEFAEKMADLGKKTLDAAFVLGQSVQDYTRLSGAMALLGVDADRAQRTMIFLSHSLQSAMSDATGKAATGFKNLGISMAEVRANSENMTSLLSLIIEHVERLGLSARNAGALRDVLGRGLMELAPLLRAGTEEWKAALDAAEQYKDALSKAAPGMDETKKQIDKMQLSLKVLSIEGFRLFKSDIDAAVKEINNFIQGAITLIHWLEKVYKGFIDAGHAVEAFVRELAGLGPTGYAEIPAKPLPKSGGGGPGTDKAGKGKGAGGDDRFSIYRDELRQQLEDERNFLSDSKKEELAFWEAKLAITGSGSKEDLKLRREINSQIFSLEKQLAKEAEQVAIEEQTYKESANDLELARKKQQLDTDQVLGRINERQNLEGQKRLVDDKIKADEEYYHAKEAAAEGDLKKITELEQAEYLDHQKLANQNLALDNKILESSHATWKQIGDSIASAVDRSVLGVIQGTNTMAQAFRDLGQSILSEFLNLALKKATSSLFDSVFDAFKGGSGLLGGLGSLFGAGAGAAAVDDGLLTSAGTGGFLGGIAKLFAPLGALFALEGGGVVPSARFGWQVPSFANGGIPAVLHGGEMVLPKHLSDGVQDAIGGGGFGGGGLTMNFHGPSDGASIKRWVGDTLRQNPNYVSDLFRRNAITPRNS